jgi:hypothetical protein
MEAEVSETVLPANCAILPAPCANAAAAPNPPRIEATSVKTPVQSTDKVLPRTIGPPTPAELDLLSNLKNPASEPVKAQSGTKLPPVATTLTGGTIPCPVSCDSHPRTPWNKLINPKNGANKVAKSNFLMPKMRTRSLYFFQDQRQM